MESAPRDGRRIVGWFGDRCIVVFWRSGPEYVRARGTGRLVWYWSDGYSRYREPDCWQPQPQGPDTAVFPVREPPPKPRGPTTVVASPAARRRLVEHKPQRRVIAEKMTPVWCDQCQRRVHIDQARACLDPHCKAKAEAA